MVKHFPVPIATAGNSGADTSRRGFIKTCLATATAVSANPALLATATPLRTYERVLLTNKNGDPLKAADIKTDEAFIFHYPHVTTPCFLLNLGAHLPSGQFLKTADQEQYQWQGGAGSGRSIVAFSAICAHKLSYPTRTLSFLNYRAETTRFLSSEEKVNERSQIIYCCSERSAYDPTRGASVLGGPANQPLTAIELEYDEHQDNFYAVGTRGGELYESFFEKFGFRLALDHQIENVRALSTDRTTVYHHTKYSRRAAAC